MSPLIVEEMEKGVDAIVEADTNMRNAMLAGSMELETYKTQMVNGNTSLARVKSWAKSAKGLLKSLEPPTEKKKKKA